MAHQNIKSETTVLLYMPERYTDVYSVDCNFTSSRTICDINSEYIEGSGRERVDDYKFEGVDVVGNNDDAVATLHGGECEVDNEDGRRTLQCSVY